MNKSVVLPKTQWNFLLNQKNLYSLIYFNVDISVYEGSHYNDFLDI